MRSAESRDAAKKPTGLGRGTRVHSALVLTAVTLALFATVVALQWRGGAFTAEFSGYPDEASHYLSGLLVRNYIAAGFPESPIPYAEKFYIQYPYMGFGHWPPLFYAVEGVWMLLFSPARVSVITLMALVTTLIAVSIYRAIQEEFGHLSALAIAFFLVLLPLVQLYSAMVMLDTPVALFGFWAVLCFGRFLDTGRKQDAVKFGALSAIAILIKGNGFYLALVPPIAVLLSRRFDLLKRVGFWIPALIVLLVAAPVTVFTMRLMLPTFEYTFGMAFTEKAVLFYSGVVWKSLGPVVLALAAVGFVTRVFFPEKGCVDGKWSAAAAALICLAGFYCMVPAGVEPRYVTAAVPFILMFFVAGADFVARRAAISSLGLGTRRNALILASIGLFLATSFDIPKKISYGFRDAARDLVSQPDFQRSLSMVSSNTNLGEGIFLSEIAMAGHRNPAVILRASKVLADNDWSGMYYRARFATPQVLNACLQKIRVRYLILDVSPPRQRSYQHHEELTQIVNNHADEWKLSKSFAGDDAEKGVRIYRSTEPANSGTAIASSDVFSHLNLSIDHWPLVINLNCDAESGNGQ